MTNTIEFSGKTYYYREKVLFTGSTTRHGFKLVDTKDWATKFIAALDTNPAEPSVLMHPMRPGQVSVTDKDVISIYHATPADYSRFAYKRRALEKWALFLIIHCIFHWLSSLQPPMWIDIVLSIGYLQFLSIAMGSFWQISGKEKVIIIAVCVIVSVFIIAMAPIADYTIPDQIGLNPYYLVFLGLIWLHPAFQSEYDNWVQYMLKAILEAYLQEQKAEAVWYDQNKIAPAFMWIFNESEG